MLVFQKRLPFIFSILGIAALCAAAPFTKTFPFVQPDGTRVELWGTGDEFRAVFETLDGYTVLFVPAAKAYFYAGLSADGTDLIPTALQVGQGDPSALGLAKHLRMSPEVARAKARARFARWDAATKNSERWLARKAAARAAESAAAGGRTTLSPPAYTTTGTRAGLCLLIDFSDATNTISRAEIVNFCNGDAYTGFGNNGSVKKYFQDNSGGLLTYTNIVTVYIRMARPKTYYNDTSADCGDQANLLIKDAVAIMKALPNYASEIAPAFANLTVDGNGYVQACNVFYAGDDSGVWSYGLWPHSWALYNVGAQTLTAGIAIHPYQITNIGSSLELGTFCHENGHMLCDYPDLYDYDIDPETDYYDSVGGAGAFCLMNSGGYGANPVQVCAYLKRASGWATTIDLTSASSLTASLSSSGPGFNTFYRFVKPGVPTEYYLVENRQQSGHDAEIPASGIAVWHIDELGDRDNQSLAYNTSHANYEVTLVQADNQWHFQNNSNSGDPEDLYYSGNTADGYGNAFNDATAPCSRWWDGSASGINFSGFSASAATMTFTVQPPLLSVGTTSPLAAGTLGLPYRQTLLAYGGREPYTWTLVSNALPAGLSLSSAGVIDGTPSAAGTFVFGVRVRDATNGTATASLNLTVNQPRGIPFTETFENGGNAPDGWTQEHVSGTTAWGFLSGSSFGSPESAHGGSYNACFAIDDYSAPVARLVSPMISFGKATHNAQLSFWHCMKAWSGDQDELRVYYKTAPTNSWIPLASYTGNVPAWTQRTLSLPAPSDTYLIAFEGTANYGYGVCVDDVAVTASLSPYGTWQTNWFTSAEIAAGLITGDSGDPDGDGIPNLLEYAMALNPRLIDTAGLPIGGVWSQYLSLSYRQNKQATDLVYEVEACTNLLDGLWSTNNVSETLRSDSNQWWQVTTRHSVPVTNAPARFMRLNVTLP
ncbi:MAG TPA: M6 family metalloprotease domain-containing protein [Kiritimatiellia bacterium]|nr:M6 family metalloprotease domain-containing protein [Kiritimatiellia bacterium]HPS07745.1 M6 family metalloprotease domain-containing protein [Kiritimatiellia bacterium]